MSFEASKADAGGEIARSVTIGIDDVIITEEALDWWSYSKFKDLAAYIQRRESKTSMRKTPFGIFGISIRSNFEESPFHTVYSNTLSLVPELHRIFGVQERRTEQCWEPFASCTVRLEPYEKFLLWISGDSNIFEQDDLYSETRRCVMIWSIFVADHIVDFELSSLRWSTEGKGYKPPWYRRCKVRARCGQVFALKWQQHWPKNITI